MNKFIVFSDLHLHNWQYGASYVDGWNSRLLAQEKALEQIEDYANRHEIKNILFTGDMFHTHQTIHAGPLAIANKVFSRWYESGFKMVFLVGNHDMADKEGKVHSLDFLRPYGTVVDKEMTFDVEGRVLHCLPYIHSDHPEIVKDFCQRAPRESIMLMHQGVRNVAVSSKGFILKDEIFDVQDVPEHVDHVFTGHYHSHKHINKQVTIVGSPMQHTWTDAGESRGFLVRDDLRLLGDTWHYALNAPQFVDIDKYSPIELVKGNFVRWLDYDGPSMNDQRQDLIEHGALSVEFSSKELATLDFQPPSTELFNMPELVNRFMQDAKLDTDQIKAGLDLMAGNYADTTS